MKSSKTNIDLAFITEMIKNGTDMSNIVSDDGQTPLHVVAAYNRSNLIYECIEKGCKVNAKDDELVTPLHLAAYKNSAESASMLLEYGADFDAVDFLGRTPLHLAAANGNEEIIAMLLDAGADIDIAIHGEYSYIDIGNIPINAKASDVAYIAGHYNCAVMIMSWKRISYAKLVAENIKLQCENLRLKAKLREIGLKDWHNDLENQLELPLFRDKKQNIIYH